MLCLRVGVGRSIHFKLFSSDMLLSVIPFYVSSDYVPVKIPAALPLQTVIPLEPSLFLNLNNREVGDLDYLLNSAPLLKSLLLVLILSLWIPWGVSLISLSLLIFWGVVLWMGFCSFLQMDRWVILTQNYSSCRLFVLMASLHLRDLRNDIKREGKIFNKKK